MAKIIATTSSLDCIAILLNTETNQIKEIPSQAGQDCSGCDNSQSVHRPFGITWNEENIFIANRKALLIFDKQFNWIDRIDVLDENTHQISIFGDKIIACMTRKDCISIIDPKTKSIEMFHPEKGWGENFPTLPDKKYSEFCNERRHINSLNISGDSIYFLMNFPSVFVKLNIKSGLVEKNIDSGFNFCHGILLDEGVHTLSCDGEILNEKRLDGFFARGLAGTKSNPITGHSRRRVRDKRSQGSCFISFKGGSFRLPHGSINDIRLIDKEDKAHSNPHDFPYMWV